MSGGSQHNSNGRQSQLGAGWSPLQLQVANLLARAPQAHMGSERGLTWHTPTAPPHLYHVPAPSPPEHLQAIKNAGSNSVFRHTATPPELYRHTPTPPDKHLIRHTPSPGDAKAGAPIQPPELYPHLGPGRDKLVRPEELLAAYARGGVDLTVGGPRGANGPAAPTPAHPASPALSVRDAPTINSLIARAQPRHPHTKFEAILERLVPSPVSPHSVIVHSRAAPTPTPSPPSSNEDSADSCGAGGPPSKRKRKPERTLRVPAVPLPVPPLAPAPPPPLSRVTPPRNPPPQENGDAPHQTQNGPNSQRPPSPRPPEPHARRKTRSGSAETIDDIAAMIASTDRKGPPTPPEMAEVPMDIEPEVDAPVTVDKLKSVLASPEPSNPPNPVTIPELEKKSSPSRAEEKDKQTEPPVVEAATAPRRRSARTSNSESTNVPVESPSEAKAAEPDVSEGPAGEPAAASFVEVENQLEMMFAGIEETALGEGGGPSGQRKGRAKKRRKSTATKGERKVARRGSRASACEEPQRRKPTKKEGGKAKKAAKEPLTKDAYDSGSNASSSRSRGPFIQIRGRRDSPLCVSVVNAGAAGVGGGGGAGAGPGEEEERRRPDEFRNGLRVRGLHASTLGLRYDATTADATWVCAFCERGPHAAALGDLFGPYALQDDCDEFRALDEATRRRYSSSSEVWFHQACGVWAPGLVAAGARVWGLAGAVWAARGARCAHCARAGAAIACANHACRARAHHPCARAQHWHLDLERFSARCPRHAPAPSPAPAPLT